MNRVRRILEHGRCGGGLGFWGRGVGFAFEVGERPRISLSLGGSDVATSLPRLRFRCSAIA